MHIIIRSILENGILWSWRLFASTTLTLNLIIKVNVKNVKTGAQYNYLISNNNK